MQGLHERNNEIKELIQAKLPELSDHFAEIGIDSQMFTTEWVLDLLSHIIPIEMYGQFLDNFLMMNSSNSSSRRSGPKESFKFFYQIIIEILKNIESEILQTFEWDEALVFIRNYVKNKHVINWGKIMNSAAKAL